MGPIWTNLAQIGAFSALELDDTQRSMVEKHVTDILKRQF